MNVFSAISVGLFYYILSCLQLIFLLIDNSTQLLNRNYSGTETAECLSAWPKFNTYLNHLDLNHFLMLSKLTGPPQMFLSWLCVPRYEVVKGETYIGYPSGWSHEELIKFRKTCLLFWMLPLSGLRLRKKISSCCCPAHSPLTHSLLTYK